MKDGNTSMKAFLVKIIRWANGHNRILSVRLGQINESVEKINELLGAIPQ